MIISKGANIIMTTKAIDDTAAKYMVENNVMGLRRVDKAQLKKIARMTGATIVTSFATSEGNEMFDEANLG